LPVAITAEKYSLGVKRSRRGYNSLIEVEVRVFLPFTGDAKKKRWLTSTTRRSFRRSRDRNELLTYAAVRKTRRGRWWGHDRRRELQQRGKL
jgi:hypothetical protein